LQSANRQTGRQVSFCADRTVRSIRVDTLQNRDGDLEPNVDEPAPLYAVNPFCNRGPIHDLGKVAENRRFQNSTGFDEEGTSTNLCSFPLLCKLFANAFPLTIPEVMRARIKSWEKC
jgi:hypothetical protein